MLHAIGPPSEDAKAATVAGAFTGTSLYFFEVL